MQYIYIVSILAVFQFIVFSVLVGKARGKYGVKAPAMSGNEHFERAVRVQMNTLEQLVCFLPALFIASVYWPEVYVGAVGLIYFIGRIIYWRSYVNDPKSRGLGFMLTIVPTIALLIAGLAGAIMELL